MDRRRGLVAVALTFALAVGGSPIVVASPPADTAVVRVMNLNIFYGGDELDLHTGSWCHRPAGCSETLAEVVNVIRDSGADIVGIEEGEHNAGVIADALGWYASDRTQVISRFPIVDPPGADGVYVWVEVLPGRFVAIGNVHLPSDPYGPYEIRDGATLAEVLALETSVRLPAIADHLAALPPLAAAGMPTFLTGDFNSPAADGLQSARGDGGARRGAGGRGRGRENVPSVSYVRTGAGSGTYREAGSDLGMTEDAVKVAVHRLRRRYGDMLGREVEETVADPAHVDGEIRYLLEVIGRR